jgi:hypothetical protein
MGSKCSLPPSSPPFWLAPCRIQTANGFVLGYVRMIGQLKDAMTAALSTSGYGTESNPITSPVQFTIFPNTPRCGTQ